MVLTMASRLAWRVRFGGGSLGELGRRLANSRSLSRMRRLRDAQLRFHGISGLLLLYSTVLCLASITAPVQYLLYLAKSEMLFAQVSFFTVAVLRPRVHTTQVSLFLPTPSRPPHAQAQASRVPPPPQGRLSAMEARQQPTRGQGSPTLPPARHRRVPQIHKARRRGQAPRSQTPATSPGRSGPPATNR